MNNTIISDQVFGTLINNIIDKYNILLNSNLNDDLINEKIINFLFNTQISKLDFFNDHLTQNIDINDVLINKNLIFFDFYKNLLICSKIMNLNDFYFFPNLQLIKKKKYENENTNFQSFLKMKNNFVDLKLVYNDIPYFEFIKKMIDKIYWKKIKKENLIKIRFYNIEKNEILFDDVEYINVINFLNNYFIKYFNILLIELENNDIIINDFIFHWEKITNFFMILEQLLTPLINNIDMCFKQEYNEFIYLPIYNYYKQLIRYFNDIVYKNIKKKLFYEFKQNYENNNINICNKFVNIIEDISLNEYSINFINHSNIQMDDIYIEFENYFIENILQIEYIDIIQLKNPVNIIKNILNKISKIFIHKTYKEVLNNFSIIFNRKIKTKLINIIKNNYNIKLKYDIEINREKISLLNELLNDFGELNLNKLFSNNSYDSNITLYKSISYNDKDINELIYNNYCGFDNLLIKYCNIKNFFQNCIFRLDEIDKSIIFFNEEKNIYQNNYQLDYILSNTIKFKIEEIKKYSLDQSISNNNDNETFNNNHEIKYYINKNLKNFKLPGIEILI